MAAPFLYNSLLANPPSSSSDLAIVNEPRAAALALPDRQCYLPHSLVARQHAQYSRPLG
jgi:hypothetical protein